jgi:atypical dual specificity phosphatase
MIIDLTDSFRYYSPKDVPYGVKYVKIRISGGQEGKKKIKKIKASHPGGTNEQISLFLDSVKSNKSGFTAVHCTHGLNRTGFMICYYLLKENPNMKVEEGFIFIL